MLKMYMYLPKINLIGKQLASNVTPHEPRIKTLIKSKTPDLLKSLILNIKIGYL